MKGFFNFVLHGLYSLFFFFIIIFVVAMFSNIASGAPFPLNKENITIIILLVLWWLAVYIQQIRRKSWLTLVLGTVIYLAVTAFLLLVVYPYLF